MMMMIEDSICSETATNEHAKEQNYDVLSSSQQGETSLASSYVIYIDESTKHEHENHAFSWTLLPLDEVVPHDDKKEFGVGTKAIQGLKRKNFVYDHTSGSSINSFATKLRCQLINGEEDNGEQTIEINVDKSDHEYGDDLNALIATLSRVMVQQYVTKNNNNDDASPTYKLSLPSIDGRITTEIYNGIHQLYQSILPEKYQNDPSIEMSDMVNSSGQTLGSLPRILVHLYNILHRGIGIIVCRDVDDDNHDDAKTKATKAITKKLQNKYNNIHVYCHRRTSTKRIFPSLYDMFVGGISTSGEDSILTAAREVGEELGLKRALQYIEQQSQSDAIYGQSDNTNNNIVQNPLSDELFKCTVCTSYNRCVVTVFIYRYSNDHDMGGDTISWQEEEVSWGDFVPYGIVEKAAASSIQRLIKNDEWPGVGIDDGDNNLINVVDFQVKESSDVDDDDDDDDDAGVVSSDLKNWNEWDFVPDGLLVWVAWLQWLKSQ